MAKKTAGTETDNAAAVGAAEAAEIDGFNATGEIGKDKAVPPQTGTTAGTAARLLPGERSAQPGNILDFDRNEKYQWINSFRMGIHLVGGGGGSLQRPITLSPMTRKPCWSKVSEFSDPLVNRF